MSPRSHAEGAGEGEAEGFAGGAVGFERPGPDGVGGVLDGGAAGVDELDEVIAIEAGGFLGAGGFLLGVLVIAVLGEQGLYGGDGFRGFVAGEVVLPGAGDEGDGALEEIGAAAIEAAADEVAIGGEVGGGVAIDGEHLVFLFGGALDGLEGGAQGGGGLVALEGGFLGVSGLAGGGGGAAVGFVDGFLEFQQKRGIDVAVGHGSGVGVGGGLDGLGEGDVFELGAIEITAGARGFGFGGGDWRGGGIRHGDGCSERLCL